ncbi:divalent-cation tolerance protein CutA [Actinomycetes bacterium KLBMP 9797]
MDFEHCQVVTTAGSREAADALARSAVEGRLAACAQVVGPITSVYRWQGRVETAEEWQVVFKTAADRYPDLERHIRDRHDYDVPEIVLLPILAGLPAYLDWTTTETRPEL